MNTKHSASPTAHRAFVITNLLTFLLLTTAADDTDQGEGTLETFRNMLIEAHRTAVNQHDTMSPSQHILVNYPAMMKPSRQCDRCWHAPLTTEINDPYDNNTSIQRSAINWALGMPTGQVVEVLFKSCHHVHRLEAVVINQAKYAFYRIPTSDQCKHGKNHLTIRTVDDDSRPDFLLVFADIDRSEVATREFRFFELLENGNYEQPSTSSAVEHSTLDHVRDKRWVSAGSCDLIRYTVSRRNFADWLWTEKQYILGSRVPPAIHRCRGICHQPSPSGLLDDNATYRPNPLIYSTEHQNNTEYYRIFKLRGIISVDDNAPGAEYSCINAAFRKIPFTFVSGRGIAWLDYIQEPSSCACV